MQSVCLCRETVGRGGNGRGATAKPNQSLSHEKKTPNPSAGGLERRAERRGARRVPRDGARGGERWEREVDRDSQRKRGMGREDKTAEERERTRLESFICCNFWTFSSLSFFHCRSIFVFLGLVKNHITFGHSLARFQSQ